MEFRVLGPVEIFAGGRQVAAGPARQRAVLGVLLLELGRVVPAERLIDRVWGDSPPVSVRNALQGYVARLRTVIGAAREPGIVLASRAGGYALEAAPGQVDLWEFRALVADVARPGDEGRSARVLRKAVGLWRGRALEGVGGQWLEGMRETLELERRAAVLELYDIELRLGRHAVLLGELSEAVAADPADERLVGQLMLALYRSGRQADALRRFEQTRLHLADELGAHPGPGLRGLHQQILRTDPSLAAPVAAANGGRPSAVPASSAGETGSRAARGSAESASQAVWPVPRELPGDVAAFTGRGAELAELDRLLAADDDAPDAVVISAVSGTAGVGKTALAVRWAHRAAGRFPGGQLYVNLRGYDPGQPMPAAEALARFLRSLGVAGENIPADVEERAARYRSLLAGRRVLVVLDNAGNPEQVRPLLPGAPGCRVVVTSRDALAGLVARDGARRVALDLLPLSDAIGLLQAVIGPRVQEDPEAARLLAQRCALLPLALRVAAELAVARPGLRLKDLAAELADEQQLDVLEAGGDPRTAVRAVFSWSCRNLDDATVGGFALLGLHPGPDFEPYAAAALTCNTLAKARQLLEALARAHLIQPSPSGAGRYSIHDLLRAYAHDLAAARHGEEGQRAAVTRLADHYLHTAAAATSTLYPVERRIPHMPPAATPSPPVAEPGPARAWVDAQLGCLVMATAHSASHGWASHATRLSATLFHYLWLGGHISEASTIHSHAVQAARELGDRANQARALNSLAVTESIQGRFEQGVVRFREALTLAREAGDQHILGQVLGNLGKVSAYRGHYEEAISYQRQALVIKRDVGDRIGEARSLTSLGEIAVLQRRPEEAVGYLQQSLRMARDIRHRQVECETLETLGWAAAHEGQYRTAVSYLRQALVIARQTGDRRNAAYALSNLGRVASLEGRYAQAAGLLQQGLTLHRQVGDRDGEAVALNHMGEFLLATGQPDQARSEYAVALRLARQIGDRREQARAHDGLGSACDAAGDHDQARCHWQESLNIYTIIGTAEAGRVRAKLAQQPG